VCQFIHSILTKIIISLTLFINACYCTLNIKQQGKQTWSAATPPY